MLRALAVAGAITAASALVSMVHAQDSPPVWDTIELTNGGVLRGTLIVYEPGQPVILQLPTGGLRELAADEVASVQRGSNAPSRATSVALDGETEPPPTEIPPQEPAAPAPATATEPAAPMPPPELVSAPVASDMAWAFETPGSASALRSAPWRDVSGRYQPRGDVHLGVQAGVGLDFPFGDCDGGDYSYDFRCRARVGTHLEVGGFIDIRANALSAYRFRAAAVLGLHQTDTGGGLLSAHLRISFIGFDLGDLLVWRLGGDVGVRWYEAATPRMGPDGRLYHSANEVAVICAGPTTSLAVTLLDRSLEVGLRFGLIAIGDRSTTRGTDAIFDSVLEAAYLF